MVGGNVLLSVGAWWVINHIGLIAFYVAVALVAIYTLAGSSRETPQSASTSRSGMCWKAMRIGAAASAWCAPPK